MFNIALLCLVAGESDERPPFRAECNNLPVRRIVDFGCPGRTDIAHSKYRRRADPDFSEPVEILYYSLLGDMRTHPMPPNARLR